MDGFGLGQEIRRLDSRGFLIYVTAFQDLAFETFRYHLEALDYIVKGNPRKMQEGIRHCLKVITERMRREEGEEREFFSVKVMDVVRHIPVDEIVFREHAGPGREVWKEVPAGSQGLSCQCRTDCSTGS